MTNSPQVIDTFLFSEPHESDLLYVKLKNEEARVDWWIIQENAYTTKGEHKGCFANEVLRDLRFLPYRDKIIVCSANEKLADSQEEHFNFQREGWQRTICAQTLNQICKDPEDLIIVSDVDESIDFSSQDRSDRFDSFSKPQDRPFWITRKRYWYDFDNLCNLRSIRIPVIQAKYCHNNIGVLPQSRHYHDESRTLQDWDNPVAFEYSYVFKNWADVQRKHITYAHTGLSETNDIQRALSLNAWVRSTSRGEKRSEHDFFEKVELTEENSPKYVLDNLASLKTNIVDPNYKENRVNTPEIYV